MDTFYKKFQGLRNKSNKRYTTFFFLGKKYKLILKYILKNLNRDVPWFWIRRTNQLSLKSSKINL